MKPSCRIIETKGNKNVIPAHAFARVNSSRNPEKHWIPPHRVQGQAQNDEKGYFRAKLTGCLLFVLVVLGFVPSMLYGTGALLIPYAEFDSSLRVLLFDTNEVPAIARVGREVVPLGRLVVGLLSMPFPFTIEVSGYLYGPKKEFALEEAFVIRDAFVSYYADIWLLSLGKQKTAWGFGNAFRPLFYLDFVQEPFLSEGGVPRIWQGRASLFFPQGGSLSLLGLVDERLIEEGESPDWYSVASQYSWSSPSFLLNGKFGYLFRDEVEGGKRNSFIGGLEARFSPLDEVSFNIAGSVTIQSGTVFTTLSDFGPKGLVSAELVLFDRRVMIAPEAGYNGEHWLVGTTLVLTPKVEGIEGISVMMNLSYDISKGGHFLKCSLNFDAPGGMRFSVSANWSRGEEGSLYENRAVPVRLKGALNIRLQ